MEPEISKFVISSISKNRKNEVRKIYDGLLNETKALLKQLPTRSEFEKANVLAKEISEQASLFPGGIDAIISLAQSKESEMIFSAFQSCLDQLLDSEKAFNELLIRNGNVKAEKWFEDEIGLCKYLIANPASLKDCRICHHIVFPNEYIALKTGYPSLTYALNL